MPSLWSCLVMFGRDVEDSLKFHAAVAFQASENGAHELGLRRPHELRAV